MDGRKTWQPALEPEDLARFFVARANAGDVDGLVALYEPDAVLASRDGTVFVGAEAIRRFYTELLAVRRRFEPGEQRPALRHAALALTSSQLPGGRVTAEVARRQPDGTWLWVVDQPSIAE